MSLIILSTIIIEYIYKIIIIINKHKLQIKLKYKNNRQTLDSLTCAETANEGWTNTQTGALLETLRTPRDRDRRVTHAHQTKKKWQKRNETISKRQWRRSHLRGRLASRYHPIIIIIGARAYWLKGVW